MQTCRGRESPPARSHYDLPSERFQTARASKWLRRHQLPPYTRRIIERSCAAHCGFARGSLRLDLSRGAVARGYSGGACGLTRCEPRANYRASLLLRPTAPPPHPRAPSLTIHLACERRARRRICTIRARARRSWRVRAIFAGARSLNTRVHGSREARRAGMARRCAGQRESRGGERSWRRSVARSKRLARPLARGSPRVSAQRRRKECSPPFRRIERRTTSAEQDARNSARLRDQRVIA